MKGQVRNKLKDMFKIQLQTVKTQNGMLSAQNPPVETDNVSGLKEAIKTIRQEMKGQ